MSKIVGIFKISFLLFQILMKQNKNGDFDYVAYRFGKLQNSVIRTS